MRTSLRVFAQSVSARPINMKQTGATLLPPIPLFRGILRAHRALPLEMRSLGDDYVKSEFRRHQKTTNPVHGMGFLSQWKIYLDELSSRSGKDYRGKPLDPTVFEKMSSEQIGQLYELMHAAKGIWKRPEELRNLLDTPDLPPKGSS